MDDLYKKLRAEYVAKGEELNMTKNELTAAKEQLEKVKKELSEEKQKNNEKEKNLGEAAGNMMRMVAESKLLANSLEQQIRQIQN